VGRAVSVEIIQGDCRTVLAGLPEKSANCCVTSPPYFGLRSYLRDDDPLKPLEMGMEATPDDYVAGMVSVFREVRRVLRDDGTLWLNIGDSYWTRPNGSVGESTIEGGQTSATAYRQTNALRKTRRAPGGIKHKDLIGIPWMLAFALRADGWYLRQDIIWSKPNPMPESVGDRCTKAHEYLFLLSKSQRYYFDQDAIAEGLAEASISRLAQNVDDQEGSDRVPGKSNGAMKAVGGSRRRGVPPRHAQYPESSDQRGLDDVGRGGKRNKRSVWTVATQPYKEAHFATFPPQLIEPCILAGSPVGGTVLDLFGGSGTTGMVAQKLGRSAVLIDLNPDYQPMMEKRVRTGNVGLPLEAA
jgi:DNA modification methylase